MTSYGDPRSYGRAQAPQAGQDAYNSYGDAYDNSYDSYSAAPDPYSHDSYGSDPYPNDAYRQPVARAPVGSAAVGSAAVGRASASAPPVSPGHRYDWSGGRAAVPVSPSPTSPAMGRATVRPPGGPGGPGGPRGPGDGRPPARKKKRVWVRNTLLSILAVMVMAAGGAMVALSYYVDDVVPPEELELAQASRVYFSNGDEITVLQRENRELINTKELKTVQDAVIAAEDNKFWEHSGVDFLGIVRAAWNNFTGGEIQGASTITQQYARTAGNLHGQTYQRKLEEAAMAYKLSQQYEREEILNFYLNTVYFGRGAYGIEAAAQAYFDLSAEELDAAQAGLLAGIIRYPDDGSGKSPYDPLHTPDNPAVALERWNWVVGQMVTTGAMTQAERDQLEFPEVIEPSDVQPWHEGPQGPIVQQVERELAEMGIADVRTGGYRITTTIDPDIQQAALDAARRDNGGPLWENQNDNINAALVAIDPQTQAVLAYYGGEDGTGFDLAGKNQRDSGEWYGGRPPGSSFKIYTLIAALNEDVSFDTRWQAGDYEAPGGFRIRNAGRTPEGSGCPEPDWCTLRWATEQSFNSPFWHFSEALGGRGPIAIVDAAKRAGVTMLTGDGGAVVDLTEYGSAGEIENFPFFHHVSFGQYPVTVLDHASGTATLAAGGVYNKPHFVETVERRNADSGEWEVIRSAQIAGEERVRPAVAHAITDVLSAVPGLGGNALAGGRPAAAKTGTWEHDQGGIADAWMTGYTPQIAATVWVGDAEENDPITDQWGAPIRSSGLPSQIWKQFMDDAHAVKELPHESFPAGPPIGNPQSSLANGIEPEPEEEEDERRCRPRILCPGNGDDGDDDDDDDDGGEGGGEDAREEDNELLPAPGPGPGRG